MMRYSDRERIKEKRRVLEKRGLVALNNIGHLYSEEILRVARHAGRGQLIEQHETLLLPAGNFNENWAPAWLQSVALILGCLVDEHWRFTPERLPVLEPIFRAIEHDLEFRAAFLAAHQMGGMDALVPLIGARLDVHMLERTQSVMAEFMYCGRI